MPNFDETTLADMAAAIQYAYGKLPQERDNPAVRQYIAEEIIAAAKKGQTSRADLSDVGLALVNSYLFPPGRAWLKALEG